MSLKAFHLFFIALSALMCFGIGAFRAQAYSETGEIGALAQAIVSFVAGGALIEYARRFLKKTKGLGYLAISLVLLAFASGTAEACSVCYGDPDSPQAKAMKVGILVLLGFIGTVLTGFATLFLYWVSRSRRLTLIEKGATH
jgi:hypothetical protein